MINTNEVIDSVRHIIHKWINTKTPLSENITAGDTVIPVKYARRFRRQDNVLIVVGDNCENSNLSVKHVDIQNNIITLDGGIKNSYNKDETFLLKAPGWQLPQGIYFGDPQVITRYPAITVDCNDKPTEWLTINSTKETFNIDIMVYVLASTNEMGIKYRNTIMDLISEGLKNNIMPLVGSYDEFELKEDVNLGDYEIDITNTENIRGYRRIIIENDYVSQENWVRDIYSDTTEGTVRLKDPLIADFEKNNTKLIIPHRHIFNSLPTSLSFGTAVKQGDLLKVGSISWFAEEEQLQYLSNGELKLS